MKKFIVFGVPRSGTTALGWLLNSHPQVFCGFEMFHPNEISSQKLTREGVLNHKFRSPSVQQRHHQLVNKKHIISAFGDKTPHYFMNIESILEKSPLLHCLATLRDPVEVFDSWNQRALDQEDKGWGRGQFGVFSFFDFWVLSKKISDLDIGNDLLLINYYRIDTKNNLSRNLEEIFSHLDLNLKESVIQHWNKKYNELDKIRLKNRDISKEEESLINRSGIRDLVLTISDNGVFYLDKVNKSMISEFSKNLIQNFDDIFSIFIKTIHEYKNPNTWNYFFNHMRRYYLFCEKEENLFSDMAKLDSDNMIVYLARYYNALVEKDAEQANALLSKIKKDHYSDEFLYRECIKIKHAILGT